MEKTVRGLSVFFASSAWGNALAAFFLFSIMDAMNKSVADRFSPFQLASMLNVFVLATLLALLPSMGGVRALRTYRPGLQALRGGLSLITASLGLAALRNLPLADFYTFLFCGPLFIAILAGLLLRERIGLRRWMAIAGGFIGVLLVVRPGTGVIAVGALPALGAALCHAVSIIALKRISSQDSEPAMMLYPALSMVLGGGLLSLPVFVVPTPWELATVAAAGGLAGCGTLALVRAVRLGGASRAAPWQYSQMLWALGLGWLVFGDRPEPFVILGATVIMASGFALILIDRQERAVTAATAPA